MRDILNLSNQEGIPAKPGIVGGPLEVSRNNKTFPSGKINYVYHGFLKINTKIQKRNTWDSSDFVSPASKD